MGGLGKFRSSRRSSQRRCRGIHHHLRQKIRLLAERAALRSGACRQSQEHGIILNLTKKGSKVKALEKPEKIYLNNPSQIYALSPKGRENIGNIRETFFINMLSSSHTVAAAKHGDFRVDERFTFEIGGKKKGFSQVKNIHDSFLALDDIEIGIGKKIPLWLFGLLY